MQVSKIVLVCKWVLTLAVLAAVLAGAYVVHDLVTAQRATEAGEGAKPKTLDAGRINLKAETAKTSIVVEKVKDIQWAPRVAVYGRVVPNPGAATEIRAAFAGRLRGIDGKEWPALAKPVQPGEVFGHLEVRGPPDRLELVSKLSEAKHKLEGARKLLTIQQERVERFKSYEKSFARSELDAALVALAEATVLLSTAEASSKLWQDALTTLDKAGDLKDVTWTVPLAAPARGEITELVARPDMLVEAGGLIARVVDFHKVLVRVDIPLNLQTLPPGTLDLFVLPATPPAFEGPTNRPEAPAAAPTVAAEWVGIASQVDPTLQATGYLYKVNDSAAKEPGGLALDLWRPGLFVKAYLRVNAAKPVWAFEVPRSALLFHQGRALVYVYLPELPEPGKPPPKFHSYKRVEVNILGREGDSWIITGELVEGDLVVTEGALLLLSEEFRADVDND
jgi:hypothetical protein